MATMLWGEDVKVYCQLGFATDKFTLDDATLGVLDGDGALDGRIEGKNLTPYVKSVSFSRGRNDQLQNPPSGTAQILLDNSDRRFDPINQSSPYWDATVGRTGVVPRREVTIESDSGYLYVGTITDINLSYKPLPATATSELSEVEFQVADKFNLLANQFIEQPLIPLTESSDARVTAILDLPEVDFPLDKRDIQAGTESLGGGATFAINAGTNVLTYLQKVAQSEGGQFYMSRDGKLTFTPRLVPFPSSYAATFADDGSGIPYLSLDVIYGSEMFYNKVICAIEGGTEQVADNLTSQAEFGVSTLSLSNLLLETDASALTKAETFVQYYSEVSYRFNNLEVSYNQLSTGQRAIITGLELGDAISIKRTYHTGSPLTVTRAYLIEQIVHAITPNIHTARFQLSAIPIIEVFTLDDSEKGKLDALNAVS